MEEAPAEPKLWLSGQGRLSVAGGTCPATDRDWRKGRGLEEGAAATARARSHGTARGARVPRPRSSIPPAAPRAERPHGAAYEQNL